jgi:hydrogenase-1 operon protein HyaF
VSKLEDIRVRVEVDSPKVARPDTVKQVLNDIQAALADLLATGTPHAIDLRQLPRLSVDMYQALRDALMQGEVTAVIQTPVKVEISETGYPGVWWLRHFNAREEITTEIIEVTEMPAILVPHRVDIRAGLRKLEAYIEPGRIVTEPVITAN